DHVRNYTVGPIDVSNTNQFYIITNPITCLQKCDCSKSADEGGVYIPDNDTVFCKIGDLLSTGNGFDNAAFKAYPVPFENEVFLEYLFNYDTNVTIEVFDLKGALLNRTIDSNYSSGVKATTKLNMKGLSDEMYFVRLTTNKGSGIKKIIAQ
ncbi:T9SS type A sorting domain-containing protein, partial [Flavobacteriaceae bacterium S0862]|nr:T9SS type A sorting domain-containing protein [Flavobacteriaceae bacterium S0862]